MILIGFPTVLMVLQGFRLWAIFYFGLALLLALVHLASVLHLVRYLERDIRNLPCFRAKRGQRQNGVRFTSCYLGLVRARKRVVWGKSVSVRVELGGRRIN